LFRIVWLWLAHLSIGLEFNNWSLLQSHLVLADLFVPILTQDQERPMSLAKRKPHDAQAFFDRVDNNAAAVFASKRVPFTLVVGRSEFILVPGAEEAGWGAAVRIVVWILATAHLLALFELCELLGDFLWQVFIDHFLQVNKNLLI